MHLLISLIPIQTIKSFSPTIWATCCIMITYVPHGSICGSIWSPEVFFLTGCRTATGPVSGSAVFTPATTDGSCWLSLMDPSAAGSASSVVLTFTASISLHVRVMGCCTSRQTNRDFYPRNNGRNICPPKKYHFCARRVTGTYTFV